MAPRTPDILDCASAQWIGKRREQEDVVKSLPAAGGMLGIVCDGMGGHLRGDCASCVVAQEFAAVFAESGIEDIPERLTAALHAANRALAAIQKEPEESGTTLLAVFIRDHFLWWISVGDSPLYLWSGADSFRMDRLNEDHSMRPIADCLYRKGKMSLQGALRQRCILRSAVMGGPMEPGGHQRHAPAPASGRCGAGMLGWLAGLERAVERTFFPGSSKGQGLFQQGAGGAHYGTGEGYAGAPAG